MRACLVAVPRARVCLGFSCACLLFYFCECACASLDARVHACFVVVCLLECRSVCRYGSSVRLRQPGS